MSAPRIVVLGASGLIGQAVATYLMNAGQPVTAVARRFTPAQRGQFGGALREAPLIGADAAALTRLIGDGDVVVNCVGVLQDSAADSVEAAHETLVATLIAAMRALARPALLIHISMPGEAADDRTVFSASKRRAEALIAGSGVPFAILRPGFVFAPAAYGGSALLRALATLPVDLPRELATRPFRTVDVDDIAATVAQLAVRWRESGAALSIKWDLLSPKDGTLGDAVAQLRDWLGVAPARRVRLPLALLKIGTMCGDAASWLGWRPPMRSTALAELRRGVTGDPGEWSAATGIAAASFADTLRRRPVTVQEKWFARLYALKPTIVVGLVIFWCASALIALGPAYRDAVAILTSHGYPEPQAEAMTIAGSIMDFAVGAAIACRRTSCWGMRAGIAVSLFYMISAAILTPDLWVEPLGALVKTFPAIILMIVGLAITDER